ncbi:hypothetical protein L7F22_019473 [Adiantum nelumboides]|nr:hypothetical protein [Adiantum nelumboides]
MFHPTRGGTRGGAAYFSWDDVKKDKDRENYLGHSILAPTGRWQKNKDVTWYNKDKTQGESGSGTDAATEARKQELMAIKMREEEEMNKRLGIKTDYRKLIEGSTNSQNKEKDDRKTKELESGFTKEERKAAKRLAKMEVRHQRREEKDRDREYRHQRREEKDRDREHRHERKHRDRDEGRERNNKHTDRRDDADRERRISRSRSPEGSRSHRRSDTHEDDRQNYRAHRQDPKSYRRRGEDSEERRREHHRSDTDQPRRRYRD